MNDTHQPIADGQKVSGTYMGHRFVGTVREHRPHIQNHREWLYFVDLHIPIVVFGTQRDSLCVSISSTEHDDCDSITNSAIGDV